MLPKQVLDDKRLTLSALRVLIALAKFADSNSGICPLDANAPTLVSLARLTGIHPNNVSKATGLLQARRWLKKTRQGGGRPTLFTLTIPDAPNPDSLGWDPKRYGRYCIVPVEIAGAHDVTLEAMRVFLALSMHADRTSGSCFPGRGTTSRLTGMHVNNISDATAKLERAGWLTRTQRHGHSNIYRLSVPKKASKEDRPSQSQRDYEDACSFPVHESQSAEYLRTPSPTDAAPEYWY
ncbi:MAG: helix-turn-helix domain-containing protein [Thiobacillus sp.]|nr:helix-turn-helix domain-containing protein [Thiobacillus sp.]